jgi:aminoglycoside 6-adenylyltransferase
MTSSKEFFESVKTHFSAWAAAQDNIRAVILPGSQARTIHPADEWSDLDLEIWCTDAAPYRATHDWVAAFGTIWTVIGNPMDDDWQWLVVYEGGFKVDFTLTTVTELQRLIDGQGLWDSMERGYKVLLDKDGLAAQLPSAHPDKPPAYQPPSAEKFADAVNHFFYGTLQLGKQLCRENLWKAKATDIYQQHTLLQMLEWHAHATHAERIDIWVMGDFMREWVDTATWNELHGIFAHFDATDSWQKLFNSIALYRRLAQETSAKLGYAYPQSVDDHITTYLKTLHDSNLRRERT